MKALVLLLIFFPLLSGIISYFISKKIPKIREYLFIGINLIEMILMVVLACIYTKFTENTFVIKYVVGLGLSFKVDNFRVIYATISIFLWLMTITFSKEYMKHYHAKERYYLFYLATLAGVVGVFFSADFYTTFCFFELMSFASYPLVIHEETKEAMKAGETYLAVAVISGMILLVGIFFIYQDAGTLSFDALREFYRERELSTLTYVGGLLVLLGFGAKAGMYPLHIWLPKAHPVAPAPASALLSGILTKTGVFGIIAVTSCVFIEDYRYGLILLILATITMFLGAVLGVFSTNIKRTLACSSMSQIGFILVGVSFSLLLKEEGGIAQCGALLHMANHSLIKLVLFMSAGVIAMNIHALDLNDIKGFGRKKPFLMVIFIIGALGIMGIPLFNGYVSKTMIHEAIVEYINVNALTGSTYIFFKAIEWIFLVSGGLTIAYMTKLFICVFVEKNDDEARQKQFDEMKHYMSPLSKGVFVLSAVALPLIGVLPNIVNLNIIASANEFFGVERFTHSIHFFSWECLKGALISLIIGALVYFVIVRLLLIKNKKYIDAWPRIIDLETLVYRPLIVNAQRFFIEHVVYYVAYGPEKIINLLFEGGLHVAHGLAYAFDSVVYLLSKTALKPHVYRFDESRLSSKIGRYIDTHFAKDKTKNKHEKKIETLTVTVGETIREESGTFSFAYAMASLGIIIILLFAIFISL